MGERCAQEKEILFHFRSCGAFGPRDKNKEKAIMAWNTRKNLARDLLWNPFQFQSDDDLIEGLISAPQSLPEQQRAQGHKEQA